MSSPKTPKVFLKKKIPQKAGAFGELAAKKGALNQIIDGSLGFRRHFCCVGTNLLVGYSALGVFAILLF